MGDLDFGGRTVLVVGGSSGIGNGIAHGFRERGAAVHVWGTRASELRERLLAAPAPGEKFQIIEQALLAAATRPLARHPAVAFALREFARTPHALTIANVTDRIGISARHFGELFSADAEELWSEVLTRKGGAFALVARMPLDPSVN